MLRSPGDWVCNIHPAWTVTPLVIVATTNTQPLSPAMNGVCVVGCVYIDIRLMICYEGEGVPTAETSRG
jgi:hypothetical protein